MSPHHLERGPIATNAEERIANLLVALDSGTTTLEEAVGICRWLAVNWLHARAALRDVAHLPGERLDEASVVARQGLEVNDDGA